MIKSWSDIPNPQIYKELNLKTDSVLWNLTIMNPEALTR